jgi:hypothetical protein
MKVGEIESWEARTEAGKLKRHMREIRRGDLALCYQTHKASILVAELSAESSLKSGPDDFDYVTFKLKRFFLPPVSWNVIRRSRVLTSDNEKIVRRSTLSPLEEKQYGKLLDLAARPWIENDPAARDEHDRDQLIAHEQMRDLDTIRAELRSCKPSDPETIYYNGKTYKRDEKTIAQLKIIRGFRCQICGIQILKKNGAFYVEAAHITPKKHKGPENPKNILILCPNHHKEFDLGDVAWIERSDQALKFTMNGSAFTVNLSI